MDVLSRPANEFGNDEMLENLWVMKAVEFMQMHFNILCSVDARLLRMCPQDDVIYQCFRDEFPNYDIRLLKESVLKSEIAKKKWREFCERFKNLVEDYSYGTLIRLDTTLDYSPDNTILVPRVQFYAIESARNREGYNDDIRKKYAQIEYARILSEASTADKSS